MPRNGSGVYSPPAGTLATTLTPIESAKYNAFVNDLTSDANAARPVSAGGTGGTSITTAQTALSVDNKVVYAAKSGNYTALANDNNAVHRYTATATVSLTAAATLGANWHYTVIADGAVVTIDPNASETINGAATLLVPNGTTATIICDGTNFFTVFKSPQSLTLESGSISAAATKDFNLTTYIAAGYTEFDLILSDFIAQTDGQQLIMVVSTNGGSSWLATQYSSLFQTTNTSGTSGGAGGVSGINFTLGTLHGNAAGETDNMRCNIVISASSVSVNCEGNYWLSTTDDFLMLKHTGRQNTAGINAVRVLYGSGNITSGTYILRGKRGTP